MGARITQEQKTRGQVYGVVLFLIASERLGRAAGGQVCSMATARTGEPVAPLMCSGKA